MLWSELTTKVNDSLGVIIYDTAVTSLVDNNDGDNFYNENNNNPAKDDDNNDDHYDDDDNIKNHNA